MRRCHGISSIIFLKQHNNILFRSSKLSSLRSCPCRNYNMAYGKHWVATPRQRWTVLLVYWSFWAYVLEVRLSSLWSFDMTFQKGIGPWHVLNLIVSFGLFLPTWTYSCYAFQRPLSYFSCIVYPLGHVLDTLSWLAIFDMAQSWGQTILGLRPHSFWFPYFITCVYVGLHRNTMELIYLPEHHPPPPRGKKTYVLYAVLNLTLFCWIHANDTTLTDITIGEAIPMFTQDSAKWIVVVKYCIDLFCCTTMRLPSPFMEYNHEHNEHDKRWNWSDGYWRLETSRTL